MLFYVIMYLYIVLVRICYLLIVRVKSYKFIFVYGGSKESNGWFW